MVQSLKVNYSKFTANHLLSGAARSPGPPPLPWLSGKEALLLYGNGSGQLVYSQAHLDGKVGGPTVAGLITWSCTS
jgi:hypothetical protein